MAGGDYGIEEFSEEFACQRAGVNDVLWVNSIWARGLVRFNPLNPIVHFWLHHTAHCAEKIVSARLRAGSASAERVGQGEVGGVTGRVLCTWWLLGLALKRPWLVPGGQPHALTAWTGLENTTLTLQRAGFWQERLLGL